jgi:hypothetical protein
MDRSFSFPLSLIPHMRCFAYRHMHRISRYTNYTCSYSYKLINEHYVLHGFHGKSAMPATLSID